MHQRGAGFQRRDESASRVREILIVPEGQGGLSSVLGMHVDPQRRRLWVAANADPASHGYKPEDKGISALYAFDLETAKLVARATVADTSHAHLLNDVAIAEGGTVFVTDSDAGALLALRPGKSKLETVVRDGTYRYPNGVAVTPDGARLYVAHALGIDRVDTQTFATTPLVHADDVVLAGVDGLVATSADLVGVVNSVGRPRVVRFRLDPSGSRVTSDDVLESENADFHIPTTAALADTSLLVIANSFIDALEPGRPFDASRVAPPVILRIHLDAGAFGAAGL